MDRTLTARQQRFVHHYLANGGKGVEAAISAGYSEASAASIASKELRKQHVQQAVGRATLEAIGLYAVPALHRIVKLAEGAKSDYVQLEAAKDLLNRAGFAATPAGAVRLDHSLTVSFDLGGSKLVSDYTSDPHQTEKSPPKLEPADIIDVFPADLPDPSASSE
jgi:phage terminase small subunit